LEGTIYAAGAEVQFNGGSDVTIWDVLVLADTVDIGGNTEIAGYEYADGSQVKIGSAAALYE